MNFFVSIFRYVDDLFKLDSSVGSGNLKQFEEVINQETFWVATEILKEPNAMKRMKTIKHFIKIALHCRECKNFNSMFAIIRWAKCRSCQKECVHVLSSESLVTELFRVAFILLLKLHIVVSKTARRPCAFTSSPQTAVVPNEPWTLVSITTATGEPASPLPLPPLSVYWISPNHRLCLCNLAAFKTRIPWQQLYALFVAIVNLHSVVWL